MLKKLLTLAARVISTVVVNWILDSVISTVVPN